MAGGSQSETKLLDFLVDLATNPRLLKTYRRDPVRAMADAGLPEEDQAHLLSKDQTRISEAFAGEHYEV